MRRPLLVRLSLCGTIELTRSAASPRHLRYPRDAPAERLSAFVLLWRAPVDLERLPQGTKQPLRVRLWQTPLERSCGPAGHPICAFSSCSGKGARQTRRTELTARAVRWPIRSVRAVDTRLVPGAYRLMMVPTSGPAAGRQLEGRLELHRTSLADRSPRVGAGPERADTASAALPHPEHLAQTGPPNLQFLSRRLPGLSSRTHAARRSLRQTARRRTPGAPGPSESGVSRRQARYPAFGLQSPGSRPSWTRCRLCPARAGRRPESSADPSGSSPPGRPASGHDRVYNILYVPSSGPFGLSAAVA